MNTILEQINSAGGFFVEFAVPMLAQSSALIVILLLADLALRKKVRAVFRYCIWMLVLVKLVLPSSLSSPMSVGYWFGDVVGSVKLSSPPASVNPVGGAEATEARPIETASAAPVVTPATVDVEPAVAESAAALVRPVTWQGVVFLVWLAVVMAMGLLLLQRAIFVSGLVAQAKKANNLMNDALKFCCRTMKVNGKIGLKVSANAASPAVCGLFRPVILVPENLAPSLGAGHLRTVLLHELAHIKRGDLWVNLFQTILQIIYFYNPMLWLANCVIRRVREQAVDEAVQVAMGEKAKQYPETLVNVAKVAFKRPTLSLRLIGVVESKSTLQARIKRMLNRPIPKTAKLGILGLIAVIIFGAVLLPMAGAMSGPPTFTVKGTVTDAETGQPIAGAKVGDVERYAEGKQWTTTDVNGNYSYKTWYEEHAVKCEIAGYETQIKGFLPKLFGLDLEKERVVDFALEPEQSSDRIDYSSVTVTEGVGFDEIIFGCTGDFIKSRLGKPDKEIKNEKDWRLNYSKTYGLGFWVNPQENFLIEIRLNKGFKGKLTSGVTVSSTKEDVFKTYGKPIEEKTVNSMNGKYGDKILYKQRLSFGQYSKIHYDQQGLLFWFVGDKINQIVVSRKETTGQMEVDVTPADFDIRLDEKRGICNLVVSIHNQSNVNIPKFKLRFYRGTPENNLDEAGNKHSGWHEAGPIEPGKSWNERTRNFHLPDGQYEFHVILDYDNNVAEVDENNNRAVLQVKMSKGQIVQKLATSPDKLKDLNVLKAEPKVISEQEVKVTAKETLLKKLGILQEQQRRVERDLAMAERALDDVRARFGITDLEERSYQHPITTRLIRLQVERDNCALEVSQLEEKISFVNQTADSKSKESKEFKKAKADLVVLRRKFVELQKMVEEAKAEKKNLDRARTQYQQRVNVRDERREMLNSVKSQIEKYRIMYDEAESSILKKKPKVAKRLKIIVYEGGKKEPKITLNIPLTALKIANGLLPPKVKTQMLAQGINLEEILNQVDEGIEPTTLLDVKDGTEHIIISFE